MSNRIMEFTLPWPPSVNAYYRAILRGKFAVNILDKKVRDYKKVVGDLLGNIDSKIPGFASVTIKLYPPTLRRFDVDNHAKAILDVLTEAGIWEDDSQVVRLLLIKEEKVPPGKAEVTVEFLGTDEAREG